MASILPRVANTSGFGEKSIQYQNMAIGARSAMRPGQTTTNELPGKTIGGAMGSAMGASMAGYMMAGASAGGMTGPQGAIVGGLAGLAMYAFS